MPTRVPARPSQPVTPCSQPGVRSGSTSSAPGSAAARSRTLTSRPRPPLLMSARRSRALGELVGELHRHAAAEGVARDAHAVVAEGGDEVAQPAGVRAERVVAARLGRAAVPEEVGREDVVVAGQELHDRPPAVGPRRDAVDEQQHRPGAPAVGRRARLQEAHAMPVQDDLALGHQGRRAVGCGRSEGGAHRSVLVGSWAGGCGRAGSDAGARRAADAGAGRGGAGALLRASTVFSLAGLRTLR